MMNRENDSSVLARPEYRRFIEDLRDYDALGRITEADLAAVERTEAGPPL